MRALPNLDDEAAMLLRGKRSAIGSARKEAAEELRDACVAVQSADWQVLPGVAGKAAAAAERLITLAAMWDELT